MKIQEDLWIDRSRFDPKEIEMEVCSNCNKYGHKEGKFCRRCGGFGFIIIGKGAPLIEESMRRRIKKGKDDANLFKQLYFEDLSTESEEAS